MQDDKSSIQYQMNTRNKWNNLYMTKEFYLCCFSKIRIVAVSFDYCHNCIRAEFVCPTTTFWFIVCIRCFYWFSRNIKDENRNYHTSNVVEHFWYRFSRIYCIEELIDLCDEARYFICVQKRKCVGAYITQTVFLLSHE